jgi:asparagine synthase (glutamine-hydrolysing)
VIGLPEAYKRPNGFPKPLLVNSLGVSLPPNITHRPKQGFTLPFDPWMRGKLRMFCEERLSPERVAGRGLLKPREVQRLWHSFLGKRKEVSWSRLWILVVLEEWLELNHVACESVSNLIS